MNMAMSSSESDFLNSILETRKLFLVPSDPTHHVIWRNPPSHTWIDLFIINDKSALNYYKKSAAPFSVGHDFTEIGYKCFRPPTRSKYFWTRDLRNLNCNALSSVLLQKLRRLSSDITDSCVSISQSPNTNLNFNVNNVSNAFNVNSNLSSFITCNRAPRAYPSVDELASSLTQAVSALYDKIAPRKRIVLSTTRKPWVSGEILSLMWRRDHSYKEAKRSGLQEDHSRFLQLRRDVKNRLDTAKNAHYANRLLSAPTMGAKWGILRNLGISKPKLPSPLTCFRADDLNRHFNSVSANIPPLTPADIIDILNAPTAIGNATSLSTPRFPRTLQ